MAAVTPLASRAALTSREIGAWPGGRGGIRAADPLAGLDLGERARVRWTPTSASFLAKPRRFASLARTQITTESRNQRGRIQVDGPTGLWAAPGRLVHADARSIPLGRCYGRVIRTMPRLANFSRATALLCSLMVAVDAEARAGLESQQLTR